ncbi:MAG: RHS repeat protein [bacterium]|nr:RHS repeat protein [bacterium]
MGRLRTTTHPDGTATTITYNALGRRTAGTDQAGLTTELSYTPLGRLTQVKDALDQITTYTYDELGNRLTQTDANGRTTRFEYDRLGRQTARVFPDGSRETLTYNADSTLASQTDFNGATTYFEYEATRRLTRRAYPEGSEVTFTYTPTGQRASATDHRGTTTYAYDARDRMIEKSDPTGYQLTYTYDVHGNRTSLTATVASQAFTTTYGYDTLNRLATVTDSQDGVTSLAYDLNGNRASLAFPSGVTTDYAYDALSRLTNLTTTSDIGTVLQSYAYTLAPAGNRTRIDEQDGTSRHYTYDGLYRLTQDRVTTGSSAQVYVRDFTYDSVGNRLDQTTTGGNGSASLASTYDTRDRLLTAGPTNYGWDANGNLRSRTNGGSTTYDWDIENRLTSITLADGTLVETTYDVDGNRVRTAVAPPGGPTTAVDYLVDTSALGGLVGTAGFLSHVVAEIEGGSVQTLYTRANDQLIGLYRPASGTTKCFHADGLGSVRVLSNEAGESTDRYAYTAFGDLLEHSGSDGQPYQFVAEPYDPNLGFYYNRARWMFPETGRFLSVDPFMGNVSDPQTLHAYSYAASDPVGKIDPTGQRLLTTLVALRVLQIGILALGILAVGLRILDKSKESKCKVDVRANRVNITGWLPNYHLFIVCTDKAGVETFFRGGSLNPCTDEGRWLGISQEQGDYKPGTIDWNPDAHSVTALAGPLACDKGECFSREISNIETGCTRYNPLGPNSNTVASTLLNRCGVPRRKPVEITIGWGDPDL